MPFALLIIGIVLVVVAVRNQQAPFLALVVGDFSGSGNFWYWILALLMIGAIGYIPKAKPVSEGLLILIILALVLTAGKTSQFQGGIFQQLTKALTYTQKPSSTAEGASVTQTAAGAITGTGS